jgi:hypothetical protein
MLTTLQNLLVMAEGGVVEEMITGEEEEAEERNGFKY